MAHPDIFANQVASLPTASRNKVIENIKETQNRWMDRGDVKKLDVLQKLLDKIERELCFNQYINMK